VNDPLVYEALFELKFTRHKQKGMPVAAAEAAVCEETLKDIERLAAEQVDQVRHHRRPLRAADGPTPLPVDDGGEDQLSPGEQMQLLSDWQQGAAHPADVRRALTTIRNHEVAGTPLPWALQELIARSICAYVDGDSGSLNRAFGLTRRRGRPPAGEDEPVRMATSVFRERICGETHQVALEITSEKFGCVESIVGEAWKKYRDDARAILVTEREFAGPRDRFGNIFTPEESERFWRIMGGRQSTAPV
jgi:hypothetical protein